MGITVMNVKFTGFAAAIALLMGSSAHAAVVDWTQWSDAFTPSTTSGGAAVGVSGAIGVSYSGELENLFLNQPSWGPAGTFDGGTVGNAPATSNGIIQLYGSAPGDGDFAGISTGPDTITFSSAVLNPVMAIWSLGSGNTPASFVFTTSNISLESGGPSSEFSGSSITLAGDTVAGVEGNGVIQFNGLVTSITWSNPQNEQWYGFTVGTPGVAGDGVPEPASWALMLGGFGLAGAALRHRRTVVAVVAA
jgi:hypothetical protein